MVENVCGKINLVLSGATPAIVKMTFILLNWFK